MVMNLFVALYVKKSLHGAAALWVFYHSSSASADSREVTDESNVHFTGHDQDHLMVTERSWETDPALPCKSCTLN